MKTCSKCGQTKPLDEFRSQAAGKFGVTSACRQCELELARKRYEANREQVLERQRKYREADPEKYRRMTRERGKKWRKSNPDKHDAAVKKWRKSNPEKERASKTEWRKANLQKVREMERRRIERRFATYGKENLGAARSARRYLKRHGDTDPELKNWHYEPRNKKDK